MWYLLENLVLLLIGILFVTEMLIPFLTSKPFFSTFRKKSTADSTTLDAKLKHAKEKVDEVKTIQNEVSAHFKSAEQLKEESDNLLNNKL